MRLFYAAIAILGAAYLIQIGTPLRLHNDAIVLLSMAESAAQGTGFLLHGAMTHQPPGYPAMIALLIRFGVLHPWIVVAINLIFLGIGLYSGFLLLTRYFRLEVSNAQVICLMCLLSFVMVRHFTIALADICYLGVSLICLLAMGESWGARTATRNMVLLTAAGVLVIASIMLRRVGVALIPALAWTLAGHPETRDFLARLAIRKKAALGFGLIILSVLIAWTVVKTTTLIDFHKTIAGYTPTSAAKDIAGFRVLEVGELAANVPAVAAPPALRRALPWLGIAALALIACGAALKAKSFGPADVYFHSYVAILFVWPYYDPRFWLPVLPLMLGYSALALGRVLKREGARKMMAAYLAIFSVMGVTILTASAIISFSGPRFPDAYGNGQFRPTYCAAFRSCSAAYDPTQVDAGGLHLLLTYR